MFGNDSNYDIGQGSGGLKGIGGDKMPTIPKGGTSEGGPSKRKPFAKKNPFSPSKAHQMTDERSFSHQMSVPKLPGADAINAPLKMGSGPSMFPQGNFTKPAGYHKPGLRSIGPV
jgi:hypothetical protein